MIVYRRTVLEEGLFDQIHVDHGRVLLNPIWTGMPSTFRKKSKARPSSTNRVKKKVFSNHILFNENFIEFYEILKFIVCLVES